jgi:hypothetical protein
MAEQGELWPEGVFEIVWHQHTSEDWMAEVRDIRTNQSCQVYSLEELERFIQAHLRTPEPQSVEPKK